MSIGIGSECNDVKYVVEFWYGDYSQVAEFLEEKLAIQFYEDVTKHCDSAVVTMDKKIRRYTKLGNGSVTISHIDNFNTDIETMEKHIIDKLKKMGNKI